MISSELLEYIQRQLENHTGVARIRTKLLGNGWSAGDIDKAFLRLAHTPLTGRYRRRRRVNPHYLPLLVLVALMMLGWLVYR